MIVFLIILMVLCLWKVRFAGFHEDYCAPGPTTAVKGALVVLIFLSHLLGYVSLSETMPNHILDKVMTFIGQAMVAPFFFYSGFGIAESARDKPAYKNTFFRRRFLKTLLHFDLAVLLFVLVTAALGIFFPLQNYFLCWTGWESVGNSNWFIFVMLSLYLIAFAALWIPRAPLWLKVLIPTALLWAALYFSHPGKPWWYDTVFTFPLGILYSAVKDKIDAALHRPLTWAACFLSFCFFYLAARYFLGADKWGLVNCLFCLMIVVLTMKVQINNPVLTWLGKNAFAIYILQRLPMLTLEHFGLHTHLPLFTVISLASTLLLAWGFSALLDLIDKKCFASA